MGNRETFRASGRVGWARFLLWAGLLAAIAALLAGALHLAWVHGLFFPIIPMFGAGSVLTVMMMLAVENGRCRSVGVAASLGVATSLLMGAGFQWLKLCSTTGQIVSAEDLGQFYIDQAALFLDRRHWSAHFAAVMAAGLNLVELAIPMVMTTAAGVTMAGRPYCESCGKWMGAERIDLTGTHGQTVWNLLTSEDWAGLASLPRHRPGETIDWTTVLRVEHCRGRRVGSDCAVYFTLTEREPGNNTGPSKVVNGVKTERQFLARARLSPSEADGLSGLFGGRLSAGAQGAAKVMDQAWETAGPRSPEVQDIPQELANRVLSTQVVVVANLIGLMAFGALFVGPAMIAAGCFAGGSAAYRGGMIGVGAVVAVGVFMSVRRNASWVDHRYSRWVARRAIANRMDRVVDPEDPEAIFVKIIPRRNWGVLKVENAVDIGFLRVDMERKLLLFEGDRQRFKIPARRIQGCSVERMVMSEETMGRIDYFMAVVRVQGPGEAWEAPFFLVSGECLPPEDFRVRGAEAINSAVSRLLSEASAPREAVS